MPIINVIIKKKKNEKGRKFKRKSFERLWLQHLKKTEKIDWVWAEREMNGINFLF